MSGRDFEFDDIDYDQFHSDIIKSTFDTGIRDEYKSLWDYVDYEFDQGAKCQGILGGMECVYEAIEDFCIFHEIKVIPPLYQYIFDARGGFLTQSKTPYVMKNEWNERFPNEIKPRKCSDDPILKHYKTFLIQNNKKDALWMLNGYIGDEQ